MRRSRTDSAPNRTSGSIAPPTSTLSAIWYSNFFGAEPYTLLPYDQVNPASVSLFTTLTTLYTVITRPPIEVPFGYGLARAQRTVGAGRRRGVVVKAKFHYRGPTGPARTRTDFVGDPHGPTEFLGDSGRSGPCGSARVRSSPCSGI